MQLHTVMCVMCFGVVDVVRAFFFFLIYLQWMYFVAVKFSVFFWGGGGGGRGCLFCFCFVVYSRLYNTFFFLSFFSFSFPPLLYNKERRRRKPATKQVDVHGV